MHTFYQYWVSTFLPVMAATGAYFVRALLAAARSNVATQDTVKDAVTVHNADQKESLGVIAARLSALEIIMGEIDARTRSDPRRGRH